MRRLIVCKKCCNAIPEQEVSQQPLVLWLTLSVREPSSKLAKNDERQGHHASFLEEPHALDNASTKVNIAIRVKSDPHFHISSSI